MRSHSPDLAHELAAGRDWGSCVCGVDEVGRGPLAGPVLAAAAIVPAHGFPRDVADRVRDSKAMTAAQRRSLFPVLAQTCRYSIAAASVAEIDTHNILQATRLAMRRAVLGLGQPIPDVALIDGLHAPDVPCTTQCIPRGDQQSLSIAVASILAKVTRDRLMTELAAEYPAYGWERNAGYGTAEHRRALRQHGTTIWHRQSFAPVRQCIIAP